MIETAMGSAQTWECDAMGHMNVQFYIARATDGLAAIGLALGLGSQRTGVGLIATDHHNGTTLADLTLGWMMVKASALGLKFAPEVQSKYTLPMDSKYALDQKHESWNPLWIFPKNRPGPAVPSLAAPVPTVAERTDPTPPDNSDRKSA